MSHQETKALSVRPAGARIQELDALRGIAIALVFWYHLVGPNLPLGSHFVLGWLRAGTNLAWCGVDLFFVLSGFFIGGILLDQRDSPRLARVFYLRRAVRILPLYYVTLAVCLHGASAGWLATPHHFPAWVYALFLTNFALAVQDAWEPLCFSVLWSLAVEEQFYLLAPWVVRWISPRKLPWFLTGLIFTAWLLRIGLKVFFPTAHLALHVLTPLRMDLLAIGALVAWAMRNPAASPFFARLRTTWPGWLSAGFAGLAILTVYQPESGSSLLAFGGHSLIAGTFALLIAVVVGVRPPVLNRLLSIPSLVSLGRYSYFIYLWHGIIGAKIIEVWGGPGFILNNLSSLLVVFVAFAATWIAALISWRFFESPLVGLGHKQSY